MARRIISLALILSVFCLSGCASTKTAPTRRTFGESVDDTIADLAFAWQCDFIKVPVVGRERFAKVDRLMRIEQGMK